MKCEIIFQNPDFNHIKDDINDIEKRCRKLRHAIKQQSKNYKGDIIVGVKQEAKIK